MTYSAINGWPNIQAQILYYDAVQMKGMFLTGPGHVEPDRDHTWREQPWPQGCGAGCSGPGVHI